MLILDCSECQAAATCKLEQKARSEPCPSIDPIHCGNTMRLVSVEPGAGGPQMNYACVKCGATGIARTARPPSAERKSFRDPIVESLHDGKIPEELT